MHSHFGCSICKRRKLKCDEVKPVCGPCKKSSRSCDFPDKVIFRIVNQSTGGGVSGNRIPGTGIENEILSFEDDQVWIDVPRILSFVPASLDSRPPTRSPTLTTIEAPKKRARIDRAKPEQPVQDENYDFSDAGNSQFSASTVSTPLPTSFDQTPRRHEELSSSSTPRRHPSVDENVIAQRLMRHFAEGPSRWLDLFDTGAYYSNVAPIRATSSPLLKSSICALSAKHLHRTQPNQNSAPNLKQASLDDSVVNWMFHATEYYHRAISYLQAAVRNETIGPDSSSTAREREYIFTAVAILSTYELMDQPGTAWRAHLSALPLYYSTTKTSRSAAASARQLNICRPVFWSLARQDFLCAFINETQTRLSLDDVQLWNSAGLAFSSEEQSPNIDGSTSGPVVMGSANENEEDKRANEMIWLLSKIINYLTKGDALVAEDNARPTKERCPVGVTQEQLFQSWAALDKDLKDWFSRLPPSFSPNARTPITEDDLFSRGTEDSFPVLEEIWYDIPLCAAAMLSYHMASILLLVNRPQEFTTIRSSVTRRLRCYEYTQQESLRHAREIFGICRANPPEAVLLHCLEPLYVAGQVIRSFSERRMIIKLFKEIQKNIGWSTATHFTKLQLEWQEGGDWVMDDDMP